MIAGDALGQIGVAADFAMPGDIIVPAPTRAMLGDRIQGHEAADGVLRATALELLPETTACPRHPPAAIPQPHAAAAIRDFIPAAVRSRLDASSIAWLGELRRISVLLINLPDLGVGTPLERAQAAMRTVQIEHYRFEGSINKMSVDDKGASLIAAIGPPPLAHVDDPERAARAAVAVQIALAKAGLRG